MEKGTNSSRFFQNQDCKYFPCHQGVKAEDFNCLFCYCPLYALGKHCGGNFQLTERGVKSCVHCAFPHHRENYDRVIARFPDIHKVVSRMNGENI